MADLADLKGYSDLKSQQLNAANTYRIHGNAFAFGQGSAAPAAAAARAGRWIPVRPCLCVQDNPQNPCHCPKKFVWWLSSDSILAQGNSGRKDHDGKELEYFDLRLDSTILVETLHPLRAGALKGLGESISEERVMDLALGTGDNGVPGTIKQERPPESISGLNALFQVLLEVIWPPDIEEMLEKWRKAHPPKPPK